MSRQRRHFLRRTRPGYWFLSRPIVIHSASRVSMIRARTLHTTVPSDRGDWTKKPFRYERVTLDNTHIFIPWTTSVTRRQNRIRLHKARDGTLNFMTCPSLWTYGTIQKNRKRDEKSEEFISVIFGGGCAKISRAFCTNNNEKYDRVFRIFPFQRTPPLPVVDRRPSLL